MEMTAIWGSLLVFSTPFSFAAGHRSSGTSSRGEKVRNQMDFITFSCQLQYRKNTILRVLLKKARRSCGRPELQNVYLMLKAFINRHACSQVCSRHSCPWLSTPPKTVRQAPSVLS